MNNIQTKLKNLKTDFATEAEVPPIIKINSLETDPILQLNKWLDEAIAGNIPFANAICLATSTPTGKPSCRMLLLKEVTPNGLVFFSHYNSRKGKEIEKNPHAALLFFWPQVFRQIRVEGKVVKLSKIESDKHFAQRSRESQINAWVSKQSSPISDPNILNSLAKDFEDKFADTQIPRPKHWGGFILKPVSFEFWQQGKNRFHTRILYTKKKSKWVKKYLNP